MLEARPAVRALLLALACSACGDDGGSPDALPVVDIDNGSCGDQLRFTGELVDWDNDAAFCGVFDALWEVQGGAMDTTAPNGRFDLCVPDAPVTLVDVTPAAGNSQCTTPPAPYQIQGIAVANRAVIRAGGFFSARVFTTVRGPELFAAAGLTFDATKAHVLVHVNGSPRAVTLAANHDAAQAVAGTTWAAGNVGHDVFFPNVDPAGGSTMLDVTGGAIGTGSIPLAAGKITFVSVIAP